MPWSLIYVLPNLKIKDPFETEFVAIVPNNDPRLIEITSSNRLAKLLLDGFATETGKKVNPCGLILRDDAPGTAQNQNAIVDFRNALSISSLIPALARAIRNDNVFEPPCADYYDFYPVTLTKRGDGFITSTPTSLTLWSKPKDFRGSTYAHISVNDHIIAVPDELVAERLINEWKRRYIKPGADTWKSRVLFRSMRVAYNALLTPYRSGTVFEYGISLCLWVSAFEILLQKRRGRVGYHDIVKFLGERKWGNGPLDARRYRISLKGQVIRGNVAQKMYVELYRARNDFLHGNPVSDKSLYPWANKAKPPLFLLAPVLYGVALDLFIPQTKAKNKLKQIGLALRRRFAEAVYVDALLCAAGLSQAIDS